MQLDANPFPVNTIDFENKKVLVRPSQAESARGKNMVVAESSSKSLEETREVARKVQIEKNSRGGESIKITVPVLGSDAMQSARPRMIKPKSPEVDRWKVNERKRKAIKKKEKPKVTFDKLLAKYEHGKAGQKYFDRPRNFKRPRSPEQGFTGPEYRRGDFHAAAPYPFNGPPMPMPWGFDFAPCPPWVWCGPWMPPPPVMPFGQFHPGWAPHRRPVFDRLSHPNHNRYGQRDWSYGRGEFNRKV